MMVKQGIDPAQADHERRRQAVDLAFDAYAESFIDLYLKKRWRQWSLGAGSSAVKQSRYLAASRYQ